MYSYDWDAETGGYVLNSTLLKFSKEPRPVYYKELDILGFDKYWNYAKDDTYPYMWAESNSYWYRGRKVAQTKGGALYTAPELVLLEDPEPDGKPLKFVDIPRMVEKNHTIMESLVQETIKKVYNTYVEYKDRVDVFYVAFSGGKDSVVALDIVQRALPHNEFKVLFGDTGMEFPDTYQTVDIVEDICTHQGIDFVRACSEFNPTDSWNLFGPPATVTRWCCSVHKTAPQVIKLREITGKSNFTGMAFIGVRASESISRSEYDYVSLGEKHKGQYSCNPILEWNSAELYAYIYSENLYLSEAYKKGNKRAGCLVCPRAAERNEFTAQVCYPEQVETFLNIIKELYKESISDEMILDNFIKKGGWKARKNGRDISLNVGFSERLEGSNHILSVRNPKTDWKVWIKTIGILLNKKSPYQIAFRKNYYSFDVIDVENGYDVIYDEYIAKQNAVFIKLLKNVFRRAASCVGCRECEADCHNGYISIHNGRVEISDDCVHCSQCHKVDKGCLVYKSLQMPIGGFQVISNKSLNCYSHHAPKMEWFTQYFTYKNEFDENHSLGSQMYNFFKRFLRDAELLDKSGFSHTAEIIDKIGLESEAAWAIMLTNLSYTPQINWFVKRFNMDEEYTKGYAVQMLVDDGAKETWANDIWSSFGRLLALPFNEVGMGHTEKEKRSIVSLKRTSWEFPEPLVILYSLYKFAEACGGYYEFTLRRLLDHEVESDGVSPTQIFGLDEEQMKKILNGLSVNYPEFINASFTLDLDNITLRSDKTSADVLELF